MKINCARREIPKNSFESSVEKEKKHGRYSSSMFNIKGYGDTKWVVGCYIDIDYEHYLSEMSESEFVQRCVDFLNEPPPRKKFEKKRKSSLYGNLEVYDYKLKEKDNRRFIELLLVTDNQKNEFFWGSGVAYGTHRRRPRKSKKVS